jgi:hypothetical protein
MVQEEVQVSSASDVADAASAETSAVIVEMPLGGLPVSLALAYTTNWCAWLAHPAVTVMPIGAITDADTVGARKSAAATARPIPAVGVDHDAAADPAQADATRARPATSVAINLRTSYALAAAAVR